MKIEVSKSSADELEFELTGASVSLANALRRIAMAQVPVLAIESVTFYENNSSIFDEYIANRLGLIPITTPNDIKDGEVLFSFDAEGPGTAYSKDLKSSEKGVKPVSDKIPIMMLLPGQRLRFEAKAKLGTGRQHAKFQPGIASYSIDKKKESFKFRLESFGQIPARTLLSKSIDLLQTKCGELLTALSESD